MGFGDQEEIDLGFACKQHTHPPFLKCLSRSLFCFDVDQQLKKMKIKNQNTEYSSTSSREDNVESGLFTEAPGYYILCRVQWPTPPVWANLVYLFLRGVCENSEEGLTQWQVGWAHDSNLLADQILAIEEG